MTNLPKPLRTKLEATFDLTPSTLVLIRQSGDVPDKHLLELRDGSLIVSALNRALAKS